MNRKTQGWLALLTLWTVAALLAPARSTAFCGFYVASGDAKIFNKASKVVIARDGDRTVVTMASDFQGDPKEFAVVVPVPVVPEKSQVHVGDMAWVDHVDQYTAPRLVEYHDPNPCPQKDALMTRGGGKIAIRKKDSSTRQIVSSEDLRSLKIEAQYKVDEYEIIILSATEALALDRWLSRNGYRIPEKAGPVLASYIKQKMFFFVAKVNVEEQKRRGFTYLRPLQVAFESPRFVLPIRLGMANAQGPQEMFVFTLTRRGRVETTNYRTVRMPTGMEVPEFVKETFADFYVRLFARRHERERGEAVFLEHLWVVTPNTPSCDPCVSPFLTPAELRALGAYWVGLPPKQLGQVVVTRLHLRYDTRHFPEDLQLQETGDRENWQARYVIRHPYRGDAECPELAAYRKQVWERREKEAKNYCDLTGSELDGTRRRMGVLANWSEPDEALHWWERIWAR
jgi:hypothetical protein